MSYFVSLEPPLYYCLTKDNYHILSADNSNKNLLVKIQLFFLHVNQEIPDAQNLQNTQRIFINFGAHKIFLDKEVKNRKFYINPEKMI
ncbi:MAG: hypothetical protein C0417_06310 [Chlorobiaceae bacterium]|nr:hypothetical protein [Chlorobiaceae bacterium]